jgi:hypothetical protein
MAGEARLHTPGDDHPSRRSLVAESRRRAASLGVRTGLPGAERVATCRKCLAPSELASLAFFTRVGYSYRPSAMRRAINP